MRSRITRLGIILTLSQQLQCGGKTEDLAEGETLGSGGASTSAPFQGGGGSSVQPSSVGGSSGPTSMGGRGGAINANSGGGTSTTPIVGTGGSRIAPAPSCTSNLNLLAGDLGRQNNWIGGDPTSTVDNPCGVQGLIYIMGDAGPDKVPGNADDTCPYMNQDISPCSGGRCCVSGFTHHWPQVNASYVYDDNSVWGCGIGISLNDPDDGHGTQPYSGPAKGFRIQTSGTFNGQAIRVSYTQIPTTSTSPFKQEYTLGQLSVKFTDVSCPFWAIDCVNPGPHPHALQLWAAGGDTQGAFELCIDGVYPLL